MRALFLLIALVFFIENSAQNNAIGIAEKLVFSASYNMSGVLNVLLEVIMEINNVHTLKATLLRLKITSANYSKLYNFFKIMDLYDSNVNPSNLVPYLYKRDINEGGYTKTIKYTFDPITNTVK